MKILRKKGLKRSDYRHRTAAVNAIGQIGDSGAGPDLEKILKEQSILYPGEMEKLREAARRAMLAGVTSSS